MFQRCLTFPATLEMEKWWIFVWGWKCPREQREATQRAEQAEAIGDFRFEALEQVWMVYIYIYIIIYLYTVYINICLLIHIYIYIYIYISFSELTWFWYFSVNWVGQPQNSCLLVHDMDTCPSMRLGLGYLTMGWHTTRVDEDIYSVYVYIIYIYIYPQICFSETK